MKTPPERKLFTIKGMNIPTAPAKGSCIITHKQLVTSPLGQGQDYPLLAIAAEKGAPHTGTVAIKPDERYIYSITEQDEDRSILIEWKLKA
tara:strand:+ start:664 stop:936 length:273 start_codon:yes stop_codon:yes gene_type:complete